MNTNEALKALDDRLVMMHMENLRGYARTKAVEAALAEFVPAAQRDTWHDRLDAKTREILYDFLASIEKVDPAYAARLDGRTKSEME